MFITYTIKEEISIPVELYTHNINKSLKEIIFKKYLFKINRLGICVRIRSIEILDNIILRKDANMLATLKLELVFVKLVEN